MIEYFDLFAFLTYTGSSIVIIAILALVGQRMIKPLLKKAPVSFLFSASLFSGILLFVFLMNTLSYVVGSISAAWMVSSAFLLFALYELCRCRAAIQLKILRTALKQPHVRWVGGTLFVLYLIFFINGVHDVFIFDEAFHRPIISSIAAGNFPIHNPTNPLELTTHLNYHYGMHLLAAAIVVVTPLANTAALDILTISTLVGTFFLFFGLIRSMKATWHIALSTTIIGLLSGGFAFLTVSNVLRGTFFANGAMPYLFSGYAPLFHQLYPLTFIYIPLTFFFFILLLRTSLQRMTKCLRIYSTLSLGILLGGLALVGEVSFLVIIPTLFLYLLLRWIRATKKEKVSLQQAGAHLALAALIGLTVAIIQGGVMTGIVLGTKTQATQQAFVQDIAQEFLIAPPAIVHTNDNSSLLYFSFIKPINRILAPSNIPLMISELGSTILFFLPISLWGLLYFLKRRTFTREEDVLLALILLMSISAFFLPTFFSSGKIADEYLTKFFSISTSLLPTLFTYLLLTKKIAVPPAIKMGAIIVLIVSCVPNLYLKAHFNWFYTHVGQSVAELDPGDYPKIDHRLSNSIQLTDSPIALTLPEQSWLVTDLTGMQTYADVQRAYPEFNERLYQLNLADLRHLGISYVYLSPTLAELLSDEGRRRLSTYFDVVAEEREEDDWRMLLKLRENINL